MICSFKKNFFPQLPPGIFIREKTHKEGMGPCDFERQRHYRGARAAPKTMLRSAHARQYNVRSEFATLAQLANFVKQKFVKIFKKFFS